MGLEPQPAFAEPGREPLVEEAESGREPPPCEEAADEGRDVPVCTRDSPNGITTAGIASDGSMPETSSDVGREVGRDDAWTQRRRGVAGISVLPKAMHADKLASLSVGNTQESCGLRVCGLTDTGGNEVCWDWPIVPTHGL